DVAVEGGRSKRVAALVRLAQQRRHLLQQALILAELRERRQAKGLHDRLFPLRAPPQAAIGRQRELAPAAALPPALVKPVDRARRLLLPRAIVWVAALVSELVTLAQRAQATRRQQGSETPPPRCLEAQDARDATTRAQLQRRLEQAHIDGIRLPVVDHG